MLRYGDAETERRGSIKNCLSFGLCTTVASAVSEGSDMLYDFFSDGMMMDFGAVKEIEMLAFMYGILGGGYLKIHDVSNFVQEVCF